MKVHQLTFKATGFCQLMFGGYICEEKRADETHDQFEERTWQKRCITDADGNLAVKAFCVHRGLCFAGGKLRMKIKGEGNAEYTSLINSGITYDTSYFKLHNGKSLLKPEDAKKLTLRVDPKGNRSGKTGGKQVEKNFPILGPGWWLTVTLLILNEKLTLDVLRKHAEAAGMYDGLGSMRAGNGGQNGRYICSEFKLVEKTLG